MERTQGEWLDSSRLTVIVGHGGSGKTEFSVNLTLALAACGRPSTLADLDVVNPYFRSRERRDLLKEHGVMLIATSQACVDADLPSMPAELNGLIQTEERYGVLDIGGGATGARVLARYRPKLLETSCRVWLVVNPKRPLTKDAESICRELRAIEERMGLKIDGLVHNSHLCDETTTQDILEGAEVAKEVERMTGIPVICHVAEQRLVPELQGLEEPVFAVELYMKKPWEMDG